MSKETRKDKLLERLRAQFSEKSEEELDQIATELLALAEIIVAQLLKEEDE